jgi:hypothetical protein
MMVCFVYVRVKVNRETLLCKRGGGEEILHLKQEQVELISRNCIQFPGFAVGEGDSIVTFLRA